MKRREKKSMINDSIHSTLFPHLESFYYSVNVKVMVHKKRSEENLNVTEWCEHARDVR